MNASVQSICISTASILQVNAAPSALKYALVGLYSLLGIAENLCTRSPIFTPSIVCNTLVPLVLTVFSNNLNVYAPSLGEVLAVNLPLSVLKRNLAAFHVFVPVFSTTAIPLSAQSFFITLQKNIHSFCGY